MKNQIKILVRQASGGDAHAFAQLYEMIYTDLYRFALYTLRHAQDAEDAVSETVVDAFAQIHTLRNAEAFKSWIFRILTAKCSRRIQQYVDQKQEQQPDEAIPDPSPAPGEHSDLQRAFADLPSEDRLILSMNLFAGYSSAEIGSLLGMNPNTVRSRQSRALKKLEEQLR